MDFRQFPIAMEEVPDFRRGGDGPGEGVQEVQRGDGLKVGEYRIHPDHPEDAGAQDHHNGGHQALADAPGGGNGAVHKGAEAIAPAHDPHPEHTGGDDLRLLVKRDRKASPTASSPRPRMAPEQKE